MAEQTKITWCDSTFNPWIGCSKVSAGCANCYAETLMDKRYGKVKWGPAQERKRTSASNWKLPLKWNREAERQQSCGDCDPCAGGRPDQCAITPIKRPRVFCASLADWLDKDVEITWLADLLMLIRATPNLDWLLLSKRLENFEPRLLEAWSSFGETASRTDWVFEWATQKCAPPNVWVGTSVENQAMADRRIPELLRIPARVRFLSVEPMLGPIDFSVWFPNGDADQDTTAYHNSEHPEDGISWAIFGGESGTDARPCNVDWIRDGVRQCKAAGVAAFVKQVGARCGYPSNQSVPLPGLDGEALEDYGDGWFTWRLKDRKGGDMEEWPEDLRVREFPTA